MKVQITGWHMDQHTGWQICVTFVSQSQMCTVAGWPMKVLDFCSTQFMSLLLLISCHRHWRDRHDCWFGDIWLMIQWDQRMKNDYDHAGDIKSQSSNWCDNWVIYKITLSIEQMEQTWRPISWWHLFKSIKFIAETQWGRICIPVCELRIIIAQMPK